MKKIIRIAGITFIVGIMITAASSLVFADASDVPSVVKGYVGDNLNIEDKYDVLIDEIDDETIFDIDECCLWEGKTRISFYDYDDNYGETTVKISFNPDLRLVADSWRYSNSGKYYYLRLYNISNKTVTVTNSTANYVRTNKTSENKKFKLTKKSVKIAAGGYKVLTFKRTSGKIAYMPSTNKAYMKFKVKYGGKKYDVKVVHGDVNFYKRSGGKWKYIDLNCDYDHFLD